MSLMDYDLILIGNGPSALNQEAGEVIDQIPNICRFNKFITGKFSKNVGTRTTHWVTYWGHQYKDKGYKEIISTCYKSPKRFSRFCKFFPKAKNFPIEIIEKTKRDLDHKAPSAGAYALTYFMESGEYENIAIFGFDHFSGKGHHYANTNGRVGHHNAEKENKLFQSYIDQGRLSRLKI